MEQRTINVGLLGSTGTVGQRFIQLLNQHPFLKLTHLGASNRSTHKLYKDAVNWKLSTPLPLVISNSIVHECIPENFTSCSIIFSGLDSCVAGQIELDFVKAGFSYFFPFFLKFNCFILLSSIESCYHLLTINLIHLDLIC